ncbi:hypothetical protein AB1287_00565 [Enterobacter asburiae]|uniref:hypothetical protein n=1 Tax=unclassified Scandinavium TaxID=2830652 RepID=UPI00289F632B|nr:hypothetical protein [Scandinavium sp.]
MKISPRDVLIIVVVTALLLFGRVSFEAKNLKFDRFEAQHLELLLKGVLRRAQQ